MKLSFKIQYVIEVLSESLAQEYLSVTTINALQDILNFFLECCDIEEQDLYIPGDIMYKYKNIIIENGADIWNVSSDCSSYINEFYYIFENHRQRYILIKLGKYLKQVREDKKLTLSQVASMLCVSYEYIGNLENGIDIQLDYFQILELANLLEIDSNKIWDILNGRNIITNTF